MATVLQVPRLTVEGDWQLATPEAFAYFGNTTDVSVLLLEAEELHVQVLETRFVAAPLVWQEVPGERRHEIFDLHGATLWLSATGDHAGLMGLTHQGGCMADLDMADARTEVQGSVGNDAASARQDSPQESGFTASWTEPMLRWEGVDTLACEGKIHLKIFGPDLVIDANNRTEWTTGQTRSAGEVASDVRESWLVLDAENARITLKGPADVATPGARLDGTGEVLLPTGREVGDLGIDLEPLPNGVLGVDIAPAPRPSALARAVQADTPMGRWLPVGIFAAGLAVAGAVAGVALRHRRRETDPDALAAMALAEAEAGRFEAALEWSARARKVAPASRRLLLDEAGYLAEMGRFDEALGRCEEAAALAPDGEPHLVAARLLALSGAERARVEARLVAALDRSPELALEVEQDPALRAACAGGEGKAALSRARKAMGR